MTDDDPTTTPPDDEPIDREHLAAIGSVASNWAYFEMVIDHWCFRIADIPKEIGSSFAAQLIGHGKRIDAFIALADHFEAARKTICELHEFTKEEVGGLAEQRNRVIHDPWIVTAKGAGHRFEITARRKLRRKVIRVPTEELWKLAANIDALTSRFVTLATRVYDETETSRGKSPRVYSP